MKEEAQINLNTTNDDIQQSNKNTEEIDLENPNDQSVSEISTDSMQSNNRRKTHDHTLQLTEKKSGRKRGFTLSSLLKTLTKTSDKSTKADTNTSYGNIEVEFKSKK